MKILHLISQHPESTGSGFYIQNMIRQADAAGHDSFLLAGNSGTLPQLAMIAPERCRFVCFGKTPLDFAIPGMNDVMPYPSSRYGELDEAQLARYCKEWEKAIRGTIDEFSPDLIHSHHLWIASAIARRLSEEAGIAQVISCHSTDLRQYRTHPHLQERVEACRQAEMILALSRAQKEEIVNHFGVEEQRVTIVGGGMDTATFHPAESPPPPPVQLLYAGKWSRAKGVEWLLESLADFSPEEIHLHLAGSGSGKEAEHCLALSKRLAERGLVTIEGRVPQPKLVELMQTCHLFVLPSFYEGLPLVLLEALACGGRLLCTDLPGCQELLGEAAGGLATILPLPQLATVDQPFDRDRAQLKLLLQKALRTAVDHINKNPELTANEQRQREQILASVSWSQVFARINPHYDNAIMKRSQQSHNPMNYTSISFQGIAGAYSDLACRTACPDMESVPCKSFEAAFRAVREKKADLAMIPVDNTIAGRVADVHHLLPESRLHIVGEHFQRISHCLVGLPGAKLEEITDIHSHIHALPQCRDYIRNHGLTTHVAADTASGAANLKKGGNPTHAAVASELAAELYGLEILDRDIQDNNLNTTRFLILSRDNFVPMYEKEHRFITTFLFEVRNIPAALYKALGGFATNNVQMVKLESYVDDHFNVARFYVDVEGHIESDTLHLALEELRFFAKKLTVMGTYPAHPFRGKK